MVSPGIHSEALLVHICGLCVAIRKAWRHFSFFCGSTQLLMLHVNIFSSASVALLFMYSIQSSNSSSWLNVLSVSFVCAVCFCRCMCGFTHFIILNVFSSSVFFVFFVFSLCVNDEIKHSALYSTDHYFVFFCWCPCPGIIHYCWCDNSVKIYVFCVGAGKTWMSILVDVWRTRTRHSGSCALPLKFLDP